MSGGKKCEFAKERQKETAERTMMVFQDKSNKTGSPQTCFVGLHNVLKITEPTLQKQGYCT